MHRCRCLCLAIGTLFLAIPARGDELPSPSARQRQTQLQKLHVDQWHQAGHLGQGVTVAILDCGFRGYKDFLGRVLPRQVTTKCFRFDGNLEGKNSQHGILCAEVVHSIAPKAKLLFATWEPNYPDQYLKAMRWARQQGANIISCSVVMPSWSDGEGGGPIHRRLAKVLGDGSNQGDVLCFASAGNTARRHWSGSFRDGGDGWHAWPSDHTVNRMQAYRTDNVSLELYWPPGCRYQLEVFHPLTGKLAGRAVGCCHDDRCFSVVRVRNVKKQQVVNVRIKLLAGKPKPFHLVALGGNLQHATANGSIVFPADGLGVMAVGAVRADGERVSYSSCGPNSSKPKPNFVAPIPYPSMWRPRPFTGTSAAAPQAAALAALCWSRNAKWNASQVRRFLERWADDLGPEGHDWETGYGCIRLPALTH